nr:GNAT family protein [Roseobacter litoralis]
MALDDINNISEWFWDFQDVALFDRSLPVPTSVDAMRESWGKTIEYQKSPCGFWFIAETKQGRPLGIAGLESINYIQGDGVIPFFVAKQFRKNGLASAMAICILDLAFKRLRLHRLTTFYRDDNAATQRALGKLGFHDEGRMREGWFVEGERKDIVIAGILGSEWLANREQVIDTVMQSCDLSFAPTCWKDGRE